MKRNKKKKGFTLVRTCGGIGEHDGHPWYRNSIGFALYENGRIPKK